MNKIQLLFIAHPRSVGETYGQHFVVAFKMSLKLGLASLTHCAHAIFPFIVPPFGTDTASLSKVLHSLIPEERLKRKIDA